MGSSRTHVIRLTYPTRKGYRYGTEILPLRGLMPHPKSENNQSPVRVQHADVDLPVPDVEADAPPLLLVRQILRSKAKCDMIGHVSASRDNYVSAAESAILCLLVQLNGVPVLRVELFARLSEADLDLAGSPPIPLCRPQEDMTCHAPDGRTCALEYKSKGTQYKQGKPINHIDPHHVTTALKHLLKQGLVREETVPIRGQADVTCLWLSSAKPIKRKGATKTAAYAAYRSWGRGSKRYKDGHIGPAGELVARTVCELVYGPLAIQTQSVNSVFSDTIPGPLDLAVRIPAVSLDEPQSPLIIAEVKNIREWIYADTKELYQLLSKAALIQNARPDLPIIPVLFCKRVNITAINLANYLGFHLVDMRYQYVLLRDNVAIPQLNRISTELGIRDFLPIELAPHTKQGKNVSQSVIDALQLERIRGNLERALPERIPTIVQLWPRASSQLNSQFNILAHHERDKQRDNALKDIHDYCNNSLDTEEDIERPSSLINSKLDKSHSDE